MSEISPAQQLLGVASAGWFYASFGHVYARQKISTVKNT